MVILQYHKSLSMISMMLFQCLILSVSKTSQALSPMLVWQSLYFPFQFTVLFVSALLLCSILTEKRCYTVHSSGALLCPKYGYLVRIMWGIKCARTYMSAGCRIAAALFCHGMCSQRTAFRPKLIHFVFSATS